MTTQLFSYGGGKINFTKQLIDKFNNDSLSALKLMEIYLQLININ